MGAKPSIYYHVSQENKQLYIETFKKTYSNESIKELFIDKPNQFLSYINFGKFLLYFRYKPELIDFILQLNRSFIFGNKTSSGQCIKFVYEINK